MIPKLQKDRIVLVHPRGFNWFTGKRDITDIANRMVPQGLLSIAAYLRKQGHDVIVYDCLGPHATFDLDLQAKVILNCHPQIVGFSATTSSFPDAADLALKIKEQSPNVITVCGGVHVSALQGKLLTDYPAFDYLISGEGEITMAHLCAGDDPACIKGLIWRRDDEVVTNEPRPQITDLDSLPFPAYELLQGFPYDYHIPLFS